MIPTQNRNWSVKAPKLYEKKYLKSNQSKTYICKPCISFISFILTPKKSPCSQPSSKIRVDIFQFQVSTVFFFRHLDFSFNSTSFRHVTWPADFKGRDMGVSENKGFSPQIIHFNMGFHYKPSILGYHYFWKHPYGNTKNPLWQWWVLQSQWAIYPIMVVLSGYHQSLWKTLQEIPKKTQPNESNNFKFIWYPLLWHFDPVQLQGWLMALHAVAW